jgi:hypothetical protein
VIKNKIGKGGVCIKEEHVCGGRCFGEGGVEANKVGCLSGRSGMDVGEDEAVMKEYCIGDGLEVQ